MPKCAVEIEEGECVTLRGDIHVLGNIHAARVTVIDGSLWVEGNVTDTSITFESSNGKAKTRVLQIKGDARDSSIDAPYTHAFVDGKVLGGVVFNVPGGKSYVGMDYKFFKAEATHKESSAHAAVRFSA